MKIKRIKKWVKKAMTTISVIIVATILTYLICKKISDIEVLANQWDQEYGHICNQYELRKYILGSNHYGR